MKSLVFVLVGAITLGSSAFSEEVNFGALEEFVFEAEGMIRRTETGLVVEADQNYRVTLATQLVDGNGNNLPYKQLAPGREAKVASATYSEVGGLPTATVVIVYESH